MPDRSSDAPSGSGPSGLHYGRNSYALSGVERTGPPDGGPARVAQTDRAGSRGRRVADRSTRRIGGFPGEPAATDLPGSAQRRGLAKSVWQAVTRSIRAGPQTGRVLLPWGYRAKKESSDGGAAQSARAGGPVRRQDRREPCDKLDRPALPLRLCGCLHRPAGTAPPAREPRDLPVRCRQAG